MLEQKMFADLSARERETIMRSNSDGTEEISYTKEFSHDDIAAKKDELAEVSIEKSEIEEEKKEVIAEFKMRIDPIKDRINALLTDLKHKSEYVKENCHKFVDRESQMVGYYNSEGDLVYSRPLNASEKQVSLNEAIRKTGT